MKKIKETDLFTYYILDSGRHLIRYDTLSKILEGDLVEREGIGWNSYYESLNNSSFRYDYGYYSSKVNNYLKNRRKLTKNKINIINQAKKEISVDKDFLKLIYKAKSIKRTYTPNRHGGILSMPAYVTNQKDIFLLRKPGAKKATIDMAFQVGRLLGESYVGGFVKIVKTIIMAQSLGLNLNIDMFDSDKTGINKEDSYTIVRVADSRKKLNFNDILLCSDQAFFNFTLFNSYHRATGTSHISGYLSSTKIQEDLGSMYDVIGGNMYIEEDGKKETVSQIMKIAGF